MSWTSIYIIYRLNAEAKLEEVFQASELKKSKYWLQYIAVEGDVLCRSPIHPKHSGKAPVPEYWQHKCAGGKISSVESEWKEWAKKRLFDFVFPSAQVNPEQL